MFVKGGCLLSIMGGVCCKPSAIEDSKESPRERMSTKSASLDSCVPRGASLRREDAYRVKDRYDGNDVRTALIDKQGNGSVRLQDENIERKRERMECVVAAQQHPGAGSVPKALEGEQVAAGWPSWLAAVAGEAIKGWLPRRADSFEKLDKVCFFLDLVALWNFDIALVRCRYSGFSFTVAARILIQVLNFQIGFLYLFKC